MTNTKWLRRALLGGVALTVLAPLVPEPTSLRT